MRSFTIIAVLLAIPTTASAYSHKTSKQGAVLRWPAGDVILDINFRGKVQGIDDASASEALQASVAAWTAHLPDYLAARFAPPETVYLPTENDRLNVVRWVIDRDDPDYEPEALATTLLTYATASGEIIDADIVVNAIDYHWTLDGSSACNRQYDLPATLTHEVGHFFGLGHSPEREDATMYPTTRTCQTNKRELSDDDIAGITTLYDGEPLRVGAGCRAAEGAGWLAGLLPLGLLFLARRRRRFALAGGAAALTALALAAPAQADTLRHLPIDELTGRSALVVQGDVVAQRTVAERGRIYTESDIAVTECWRADACPERVTVRQLGGEHQGVGLAVESITPLPARGEVVLFLRARPDGRHAPVGRAQGVFRPSTDGAGELVRDLRGVTLVGRPNEVVPAGRERWNRADLRRQVERVERREIAPE